MPQSVNTPSTKPTVVYNGLNVIDKFYEHIMNDSKLINSTLANDQYMTPLTDGEQTYYNAATVC